MPTFVEPLGRDRGTLFCRARSRAAARNRSSIWFASPACSSRLASASAQGGVRRKGQRIAWRNLSRVVRDPFVRHERIAPYHSMGRRLAQAHGALGRGGNGRRRAGLATRRRGYAKTAQSRLRQGFAGRLVPRPHGRRRTGVHRCYGRSVGGDRRHISRRCWRPEPILRRGPRMVQAPIHWPGGLRCPKLPACCAGATVLSTSLMRSSSLPAVRRVMKPPPGAIKSQHPELPAALSETQLRLLPELAAQGCNAAVMLMVELGWPIAIRGGDWNASALNHAVFRGDAELTRFLLQHGASWKEEHGYGDNVCGTLSWASCNTPVAGGDWLGNAEALVAHGLPPAQADPQGSESVIINGHRKRFTAEVADVLLGPRRTLARSSQP